MTNLDRILALLSLLAFAGFLGILIGFVPKMGLVLVSLICVVMCAYDFFRSATARRRHERNYQHEAGIQS
jgi:hypothetical protein